jgi:uncharacterized membrane protein
MRRAWVVLLWLSSVGVGLYALAAYTLATPGATVHPEMKAVYAIERWGIMLHVLGAACALLTGPAQFSARLRARRPAVHRALGRVYLFAGVLVGGGAGLYMSFHAFGGAVSTSGFATLSVLWLTTGALALRAALGRRFTDHRAWMIRNFALTFAAVTLRAQLGAGMASGLTFESFYPLLAWTSWVPNLIVAEWLVRRAR